MKRLINKFLKLFNLEIVNRKERANHEFWVFDSFKKGATAMGTHCFCKYGIDGTVVEELNCMEKDFSKKYKKVCDDFNKVLKEKHI